LTLGGRFVKTRIVRGEFNTIALIAIAVIAIAIRFVDINQPFVDEWSWRQSDVASIARNYLRHGFQFSRPQIDWAGDEPGYVGTEFPILPFLAAIGYKLAGVHEWIGRLQSIIFFAISLPFFFLLIRQVFGSAAATWAFLFYSFAPLNIMAGRCFMPDMPSLSLALIGLYLFLHWTVERRATYLFAAAVTVSLALLIKLPSAVIGAPIAYISIAAIHDRRSIFFKKCDGPFDPAQGRRQPQLLLLALFTAIALLPCAIWYGHAYQIARNFYPHHFFGAGGIRIESLSWYWKIAHRTVTSGLTPLLFVLAVFGMLIARSTRSARIFYWWLAAMVIFVIAVGYGNRHPWYQLPFVPIAAAFAGCACQYILLLFGEHRFVKFVFMAVIAVGFALLSFVFAKSFYHESAADLRLLGLELQRSTPEKSLIVAADYGDPTVFYYAERRGWHFAQKDGIYNGHPASSADAIADLEALRKRGATHFVVYTGTLWWLSYYEEFAHHLEKTAKLMKSAPQFKIFELNSSAYATLLRDEPKE
jgi:4-amino-4-deoxy-L-arabinose transferase-like glycosyltransferase